MDINKHIFQKLNQGALKASPGGDGKLVVQVDFPADEQGFTERRCAAVDCEPRLFKIRGDLPKSESRRCPYCGQRSAGTYFATEDQVRYARESVRREVGEAVQDAVHRMIRDALSLDTRGRRQLGSGMFSMDLHVTRQRESQPGVPLPKSERPRRDVKCGRCGLDHIVFGLATWCHSCGSDIFDDHVKSEFRDIVNLLRACVNRRQADGERLFARQAENVLEDLVSAWEAGLRYLLQRHFLAQEKTRTEVDEIIQKSIRNQLQGIDRSAELLREHLRVEVFATVDASDIGRAATLFAARHTVTHCLGVTDPKFVAKVGTGYVGREVNLDPEDLQWLSGFIEARILEVWAASHRVEQPQQAEGAS